MGTSPCFSTIFIKGKNSCDFLFASMAKMALRTGVYSKGKNLHLGGLILSFKSREEAKYFLQITDTFQEVYLFLYGKFRISPVVNGYTFKEYNSKLKYTYLPPLLGRGVGAIVTIKNLLPRKSKWFLPKRSSI